jgi:hypothetical protein
MKFSKDLAVFHLPARRTDSFGTEATFGPRSEMQCSKIKPCSHPTLDDWFRFRMLEKKMSKNNLEYTSTYWENEGCNLAGSLSQINQLNRERKLKRRFI